MKRETRFLKMAVVLIGFPVLALCVILLPVIGREAAAGSKAMAWVLYGILAVLYLSAVPFYMALYQAFRLLTFIDQNNAFSMQSVTVLKSIKQYAATISGIYLLGMPLFFIMGEVDDAPGVILMAAFPIFFSLVVAVFAAVLQKLLQHAIEYKTDNELTI